MTVLNEIKKAPLVFAMVGVSIVALITGLAHQDYSYLSVGFWATTLAMIMAIDYDHRRLEKRINELEKYFEWESAEDGQTE